MKKLTHVLLAVITLGYLLPALALEGESIVFNPSTGNYLITYLNSDDGKLHQVTFIPATKINPTLNSKLKLEQDGIPHYGYLLISGWDSQQNIVHIIFDPVNSVATVPDIPLNAQAKQAAIDMLNTEGESAIPKVTDMIAQTSTDLSNAVKYFETPFPWRASMYYSDRQSAFRIGWRTKVANGMHPGGKATFGFKSRDLAGIIQVEVYGYAPGSQEIPGEETQDANDGGFGQQYTELVFKNNFVPRPAAVPTIAVPVPFNAAVLLGRIQTQMHTWIAMQLLDATYSAQLDRYLVAAADAYRRNQPKAGKEHIETVRKMLKKEHEDLDRDEEHESDNDRENDDERQSKMISRLAARVLDFDLKYVMKRMDRDD